MTYLRARWYDSYLNQFVSPDPIVPDYRNPQSINGYTYVLGNPIKLSDPSGHVPEGEDAIGDIRDEIDTLVATGVLGVYYQYSCNCGWIDWSHALSGLQMGTSLAHTIFSRLEADVDWGYNPLWTGNRGIRVESFGNIPFTRHTVRIVDDIAVVPEWNLWSYRDHVDQIATGIFLEHSEHREEAQGFHIGWEGWPRTYYSEEDLPSDLIGLYMALKMHRQGMPYRAALNEIIALCNVVSKEDSLEVYRNEYQGGAGFRTGWKAWYPRLVSVDYCRVSCPPLTASVRRWPSQFSALVSGAVYPERDGIWWWWENPYADGVPTETDVEGVYSLDDTFSSEW